MWWLRQAGGLYIEGETILLPTQHNTTTTNIFAHFHTPSGSSQTNPLKNSVSNSQPKWIRDLTQNEKIVFIISSVFQPMKMRI